MTEHTHSPIATVAIGALAITAASFLVEISPGQDATFPLFMLGGPLVTGVVLGARRGDWRIGAAAWSSAALVWLVVDWAVNGEDVAFHVAIAVLFTVLVALGAALSRALRRSQARADGGSRQQGAVR